MSYDLRVAVKVEGADNCFAVIATPEYDSPTYNLGKMFRACTGWDYEQGVWYNAKEVVPLIEHGISELKNNEKEYIKYNDMNGWGTTEDALQALESLLECVLEASEGNFVRDGIPLACMYIRW